MAIGTYTFLRDLDGLRAYAFPPFAVIGRVLHKLTFEPLYSKPLRLASLLALATAKRMGKLQALSCQVASYLPEFLAKTESERNPLLRFILVRSLKEFVRDLPEERLCPVWAVRTI